MLGGPEGKQTVMGMPEARKACCESLWGVMGEGGSELVGSILPRVPSGLSLVLSLTVPCISGVQLDNLLSLWAWRLALLPTLSVKLKAD